MNALLVIESYAEKFFENLVAFCKPKILIPQVKSQIAILLNAEADLRLTLELAIKSESALDCRQKLQLAIEQTQTIGHVLKNLEETKLEEDILKIQEMINSVLEQ